MRTRSGWGIIFRMAHHQARPERTTAGTVVSPPKSRLTLGAVVVALSLFLSSCSSGDVTMPDLSGMSKDAATRTLEDAGIKDWTEEWQEGTKPLVVIDQVPEAGETVSDDTEVRVVLSGE